MHSWFLGSSPLMQAQAPNRQVASPMQSTDPPQDSPMIAGVLAGLQVEPSTVCPEGQRQRPRAQVVPEAQSEWEEHLPPGGTTSPWSVG